jgi:hypothetical protein
VCSVFLAGPVGHTMRCLRRAHPSDFPATSASRTAPDSPRWLAPHSHTHTLNSLRMPPQVRNGHWERSRGQLDEILQSLGPKPPPTQPEALGLWAAGMVNPLPPLGVAPEVRLSALSQQVTRGCPASTIGLWPRPCRVDRVWYAADTAPKGTACSGTSAMGAG